MTINKLTDKYLIRAILKGGREREGAMKNLLLNADLNAAVAEKALRMGGKQEDADALLEEALISLDRKIRKGVFPEEQTIQTYILECISAHWASRLGQEEETRKRVLEIIAGDTELKKRVQFKMKKLSCREGETEDYYNQAFIKLNEVFVQYKYQGGDVRSLFYRICENNRLNDLRKIKEQLPEQLPEKGSEQIIDKIVSDEKRSQLKNWLSKIGEKCKKTLLMWNDGYSMKEIAQEIPYKDHLEAAVAKHRCLKKIYDLIDYRLWK